LGSDVTEHHRRLIARQAAHRCEYCLLHEEDSYHPHQIDHIISRKHGGDSDLKNLAYACLRCNACKGSDIASLDVVSGQVVRLFHPRQDVWQVHFSLRGWIIEPLTPVGEVTARLLRFNVDQRVVERRALGALGRYPR
jgi:hypothetical protein